MNDNSEIIFRGKKILVVEDEEDQRDMLIRVLSKSGYEVDSCESYEACVPFLAKGFYNIIFTDIRLNGEKDGFDVLSEARRVSSNTSVIMMTAYASIDTAIQAMTSGAVDYIQKPINLVELKMKLEKAIVLQFYEMNADSSAMMRTNINMLMAENGEFRLMLGRLLGLAEESLKKMSNEHPSAESINEMIDTIKKKIVR